MFTDEIIASAQRRLTYANARAHSSHCRSYSRHRLTISATDAITVRHREYRARPAIILKLDLAPRATRKLQHRAQIVHIASECYKRVKHMHTLDHVLIATDLHVDAHVVMRA